MLIQIEQATLLLRTALARESHDFCWPAYVVAVDSTILSRVKNQDHILIVFIPNQGNMALSKEVTPE